MHFARGFSIFEKFPAIEDLFLHISTYSNLLPIIFFLIFFKTIDRKEGLWVIFVYSIFAIVNDAFFLGYLANKLKDSNKFFLSFFTLTEFLFLSFYIRNIIHNRNAKRIIVYTSLAFSAFLVIYYFTAKWNVFDSIPVGTETIIIIVFSVYYLFEEINQPKALFIYNTSSFWVIVGFLLYLAGSFFIYIYAGYAPIDEMRQFWFVPFVLNTLKNIFFSIGILVSHYHKNNNYPNPYIKNQQHILN